MGIYILSNIFNIKKKNYTFMQSKIIILESKNVYFSL